MVQIYLKKLLKTLGHILINNMVISISTDNPQNSFSGKKVWNAQEAHGSYQANQCGKRT